MLNYKLLILSSKLEFRIFCLLENVLSTRIVIPGLTRDLPIKNMYDYLQKKQAALSATDSQIFYLRYNYTDS
ncbi:MAG: hypothetical protein JWP12_3348 [Bacteroidetes bacterium]|nr:hypothetical protein [Bacteroidota bacterium]